MAETTVSLEPHELLEEAYEFLTLFYEEYSRDRFHISERWREACIEIEKLEPTPIHMTSSLLVLAWPGATRSGVSGAYVGKA